MGRASARDLRVVERSSGTTLRDMRMHLKKMQQPTGERTAPFTLPGFAPAFPSGRPNSATACVGCDARLGYRGNLESRT